MPTEEAGGGGVVWGGSSCSEVAKPVGSHGLQCPPPSLLTISYRLDEIILEPPKGEQPRQVTLQGLLTPGRDTRLKRTPGTSGGLERDCT